MKGYDDTILVPIVTYNTLTLPAVAPTLPATRPSVREALRRAWGHLTAIVARAKASYARLEAVGTPAQLDGPVTVEVPIIRPSGQASRREVKAALALAVGMLALCGALILASVMAPAHAAAPSVTVTPASHSRTTFYTCHAVTPTSSVCRATGNTYGPCASIHYPQQRAGCKTLLPPKKAGK